MAKCKFCDEKMDWGQDVSGKWVKLVPIGEEGDLDRSHQDENGVLRAQHKCVGWTAAVQVVKLAKPISAADMLPMAIEVPPFRESFDRAMDKAAETKRRRKAK